MAEAEPAHAHGPAGARYPAMVDDPVLAAGFHSTWVRLGSDSEGEYGCTLLRRSAHTFRRMIDRQSARSNEADVRDAGPKRTVAMVDSGMREHPEDAQALDTFLARESPFIMYLHGWSDYFFHVHVADFFNALGFDFCAIDLRKYGRSLREGHTATAIDAIEDYGQEIEVAIAHMSATSPRRPIIYAHSTGGLTAALWSADHPGASHGLILNSPWLELHGGQTLRHVLSPVARKVAAAAPQRQVLPRGHDFYARSHRADYGGDFAWHEPYKPARGFPFPANTLAAIMAAHERVARGLHIREPILVSTSSRSSFRVRWSADLMRADTVVDVRATMTRARTLGTHVDTVTIPGAAHDIALSGTGARTLFFTTIAHWLARLAASAQPDDLSQ